MPLTKEQLFAYQELGWVVVKRVADAVPGVGAEWEFDPSDMCFFGALVSHGSQPNRTNDSAVFNTVTYSVPGSHEDKQAQFEILRG